MFHTQEGLTSHTCFPNDQWLPPRGNQDQQGQDGHQERDAEETSQPRKRRKRPQPKASFLPPAPSASGGPGPEEGHQSCLWSPVLLVDHSLQGLCPRSPDTPPPVLSPIREGSGLDSSTLCSMSTQAGPDKLISTELGSCEGDRDKEPLSAFGDVSSPAFPDSLCLPSFMLCWGRLLATVTELCNLACSSTMPGGGTNLELALHCLHEAQGEVPVALETLLLSGPQKPPTHPLADYHYAGSAVWTPTEKELFNKAFQAHKNNFSLIHKMVQTKSVAQCVEYYYTWKKRVRFTTSSRAPGLKKSVKRKLPEADPTETKATASPEKRRNHHSTPDLKMETESCRGQSVANTSPNAAPKQTPEPLGVFDKMCTHYVHMKRHRNEDPVETTVGEERPAKAFKVEEEEKEEEGGTGADMGPLQGDLGHPAPANPESCSHLLWRHRKTSEKTTPQSGHNPLSGPKTKPTQSVVRQPVNGPTLSYDWTVTGYRRGQPPPRGAHTRRLYLRGNNGPGGDAQQAVGNYEYSKDSQGNTSIKQEENAIEKQEKDHGNWRLFLKSKIN
ncbi:Zinc finger protein 541 [Manis javanica]|nr:Zinc finger protein 541 [Manis javanica]